MAYGIYIFIIYICKYVSCFSVPTPDKIIIVGDINVLNMVRNFYEEVIIKYNVPNFSMVVWNPSSYDVYKSYGIPVEYSPIKLNDEVGSTFQYSEGFTKKINDRYRILLEYLKEKVSILSLDADLYFFENPLTLLNYVNPNDDITFSTDYNNPDHTELNVGLMYIKPTNESIKLFEKILKILKIAQSDFAFIDQGITNLVISSKRMKNLKYGMFDMMIFVNGFFYFRYFKQFIDDEMKYDIKTIGFHNNWIIGGMAKIYRLKELGLWKIDDNEYYSSKTRKYIKYSLIIHNNYDIMMIYLIYLGEELNRTIILPRFSNTTNILSFLNYWNLAYFERTYGLNYRENVFLLSPLVPKEVKDDVKDICTNNINEMKLYNTSSVLSINCIPNEVYYEMINKYKHYF